MCIIWSEQLPRYHFRKNSKEVLLDLDIVAFIKLFCIAFVNLSLKNFLLVDFFYVIPFCNISFYKSSFFVASILSFESRTNLPAYSLT